MNELWRCVDCNLIHEPYGESPEGFICKCYGAIEKVKDTSGNQLMEMRLTEKDIKEINNSVSDSWNQGIFTEPNWIPNSIKEPVIYMRWSPGGISGGSCWDDSDPQEYYNEDKKPKFEVLDKVLMKLCPNISYLQYREIESLIKSNSDTEWEYYGNCTNWQVEFIILNDLYKHLGY